MDLQEAIRNAASIGPLKGELLELLRREQEAAGDGAWFRDHVRWPIVQALVEGGGGHQIAMKNGLQFEVTAASRIERSVLLSLQQFPDHVWEPQTTKLLLKLGKRGGDILIGGAFTGDHAVPLAASLVKGGHPGCVHAFEPFPSSFQLLEKNIQLNNLENLTVHQLALWDQSGRSIEVASPSGEAPLATPREISGSEENVWPVVKSVSIDEYLAAHGLGKLGVIMVDLEGGEELALRGAAGQLAGEDAPAVIFEIHRDFTDWTGGLRTTSILQYLESFGYECFAIRDLHGNLSMGNRVIEVIPSDRVYLEGPPHGFNMLAIKTRDLLEDPDISVVYDVSPKYLEGSDPKLHHPLDGLGLKMA